MIAKAALVHFWEKHPDAKGPLMAWHSLMRQRTYEDPNELKAEIGNVSLFEDGHACFNIGGNKYRLVVHMRYDVGIIFIKHVLTHAEYTKMTKAGTLIQKK